MFPFFLLKLAFFWKIIHVLNLEIPELTNFCLLLMRYTDRSMLCMILEVSSILIYQGPSKKYDMKVLFLLLLNVLLNKNKMGNVASS